MVQLSNFLKIVKRPEQPCAGWAGWPNNNNNNNLANNNKGKNNGNKKTHKIKKNKGFYTNIPSFIIILKATIFENDILALAKTDGRMVVLKKPP